VLGPARQQEQNVGDLNISTPEVGTIGKYSREHQCLRNDTADLRAKPEGALPDFQQAGEGPVKGNCYVGFMHNKLRAGIALKILRYLLISTASAMP